MSSAPLAERIDPGSKSGFFAHHADYAAATTADRPRDALPAFARPHDLLDARLLQVWSTALDRVGNTEHARYFAQRLREFRNNQSTPFFAPCTAPHRTGKAGVPLPLPLPLQCGVPVKELGIGYFHRKAQTFGPFGRATKLSTNECMYR